VRIFRAAFIQSCLFANSRSHPPADPNKSFATRRQTSSIPPLAESTQVNKLTVIEAYNVLEADGLVERQGSGHFVSPATIPRPQSDSNFAPPQDVIVSGTTTTPPLIKEVKGIAIHGIRGSTAATRNN